MRPERRERRERQAGYDGWSEWMIIRQVSKDLCFAGKQQEQHEYVYYIYYTLIIHEYVLISNDKLNLLSN